MVSSSLPSLSPWSHPSWPSTRGASSISAPTLPAYLVHERCVCVKGGGGGGGGGGG